LGKTTLVRHLFDHDENFEGDPLITNNKEIIEAREILLILDDVWEKDQGLWDSLRNNLQRIGDPSKSLVLITTHSTEVAEKAQVVHRHDLKGLLEEDGWAVFSACEKSCNFEDVRRRIVSKCKGVPLAIKAMGALLQSKKHPRDWESILAVELWDLPQKDKNDILPSLLLSFNHLPYTHKINFRENNITPGILTEVNIHNVRAISFLDGVPTWDSIICARYILKELPKVLYKLGILRHVDRIDELDFISGHLSASRCVRLLTKLQTLPPLELPDEDEGLENVKNKKEATKASLWRKDGISQLSLAWMESLEPHPNIISLSVWRFQGMNFPRWIKTMVVKHTTPLTNLISVEIINCERYEHLPTLGQLPSLNYLTIEDFKKMETIGNYYYEIKNIYKPLIKLYFEHFYNLTTWKPETSAFPSLETLDIRHCPRLESVPTLQFQYLKQLIIEYIGGT
ncbi:putative disease resistance protein RGA3, partial [Bienertia sinuspersici]